MTAIKAGFPSPADDYIEGCLLKQNQKSASRYTRSRRPVTLAAVRDNLDKFSAFKLEYRIEPLPVGRKISALKKSKS